MATIPCPKCARPLSPAASNCPSCGSPANAYELARQYAACRTCSSQLRRDQHAKRVTRSYVVDGTTRYVERVQTSPCGHCGEPNPLGVTTNPYPAKVMWAALLSLAIMGGLFLLFALA